MEAENEEDEQISEQQLQIDDRQQMFEQDPREIEDQMEYVPEKVSANFNYDAKK